MKFHISTPQSVGEYVAMQDSRRAAKRKSAHGSNMEPSTKKQKFLHGGLPSAPAPAQSQGIAMADSRPTDETPKLVDASLPLAHNTTDLGPAPETHKLDDAASSATQTQSHDITNLDRSTMEQKPDHSAVTPAQSHDIANPGLAARNLELNHDSLPPAQAQPVELTDLEPAAKRPELSFASLPKSSRKRVSSEESLRAFAVNYRKRLVRWCESQGYNYHELDAVPDTLLTSPGFDIDEYMAAQSSKGHSHTCRTSEPEVHPVDGLSAENLRAEGASNDAHSVDEQIIHDRSCHSPNPHTAVQVRPVSGDDSLHNSPTQDPISKGLSDSGVGTSHLPPIPNTTTTASLAFGREPSSSSPPPGDQKFTSVASLSPSLEGRISSSSDINLGCNTTPVWSDQNASNGSDRGLRDKTAASNSDHFVLLSPETDLRDNTTSASSSQIPSDDPPRNKGGRPRGRKPRVPKTPKRPTRFQKNHPVKAKVNFDVWENILVFCPSDFLLKARSISSTFRTVLQEDSSIWKRARINTFGADMPEPPLGLSEPQYADLITGTGCQTRGCTSTKTRKTYWALQKRLCIECFNKSFLPPRALQRVFKELETSPTPEYNSIARYYRNMDEFLPGMKFDRWDNYQWLGEYDPAPSWGQVYRSGQYTGYPAAAYASFSSELAVFVGNEYDVEQGRFSSHVPMPGKTCPPQDEIDAWFEAKRAANDALVPVLQTVENWSESYKRDIQKTGKDLRKSRELFYEEQAELAGLNKVALPHFKSYQAAIAISKPASEQSWKILLPKILVEYEATKKQLTKKQLTELEAQQLEEREREPCNHDDVPWAEEEIDPETGLARDRTEEEDWPIFGQ